VKLFDVTISKDKTEKDYVAIFTDMTSRAVHLEVTSGLSTEDFLLAIRRMVAERGTPAAMYSDEARTFLKAAKELKVLYASLDQTKIQEERLQRQVEWNFNTPHAQFRDGCWERLVCTFKETLRRNILQQRLRQDIFATVVKEVQGFMNDHPLVAASEQPDGYDVVTPSMLLAGQRLLGMPHRRSPPRRKYDARPVEDAPGADKAVLFFNSIMFIRFCCFLCCSHASYRQTRFIE